MLWYIQAFKKYIYISCSVIQSHLPPQRDCLFLYPYAAKGDKLKASSILSLPVNICICHLPLGNLISNANNYLNFLFLAIATLFPSAANSLYTVHSKNRTLILLGIMDGDILCLPTRKLIFIRYTPKLNF